jgi:lysophospholipase L1-like esterase
MPVIVAFGDSNTWGYDPATAKRFEPGVRWTGVMARELGQTFDVIEEGLNGRTTVHDDPFEPFRNGLAYLNPCLLSHAPFDLIVISLGCNDLKHRFGLTAGDVAKGAERLVMAVAASSSNPIDKAPKVILVSPPPLVKLTALADMFDGGAEKSRLLAENYRAVAALHGVGFVDAGRHIRCSPLDGIHYEADQHAILGAVLAEAVRQTLA